MLTNKGAQALLRVERLMDEASRAMVAVGPAAPAAGTAAALGAIAVPGADTAAPAAPTTPARVVPGRASNGKTGSVAAELSVANGR